MAFDVARFLGGSASEGRAPAETPDVTGSFCVSVNNSRRDELGML